MVRNMVPTCVRPGFKPLIRLPHFLVLLAILLCASSGCVSRQYTVTLRDEQVIRALNRPKLDKATATYTFKDLSGQKLTISAYHIREIEIR
jgi:hypothetical protein